MNNNIQDQIKNQQIIDDMDTLYGKIIKYVGEYNNNYCIIIVKAPDKNRPTGYKSVSCMGVIYDVPVGTMCKFTGSFEYNKNKRKTYKFNSYRIIDPNTTSDIIKYLCDQIDKIDIITAKKICDTFGEDTINVLDNEPEKLLTIKGIGRTKIEYITNSWKKHRESMEIHIRLQKAGISLSVIEFLKKNAKNKNQSIKDYIIENSYDLIYINDDDEYLYRINQQKNLDDDENATRKRLLTFYDIEQIYQILAPDEYENNKLSYKRIEAGIYTYLKDRNFETGNICQKYKETIKNVSDRKYLNVNYMDVAQVIADKYNKENKHLKIEFSHIDENNDPVYVVYTQKDYHNECILAHSLLRLQSSNLSTIKYDKNQIDSKYNEDQKNAIIAALENSVSIITGGPGTGKTTIINEIISICEYKKYKKIILLAPTAKAAKKMNEVTGHIASTIHSVIFCKKEELYDADIVIVDESSMLDNTIASKLISMMELHQKIILVGDTNQLPSVDIGNVLQDIIDSNIFPVTRLTKIYRQKYGNDIIAAAKDINDGIVPKLDFLNDVVFIDIYKFKNIENTQFYLLQEILNEIKKHLEDEEDLIKEVQILSPIKKYESGVFEINQFMQQYLYEANLEKYQGYIECANFDEETRNKFSIKKGYNIFNFNDKVINTKNDYDKMVFNGEIGIIKKIIYDSYNSKKHKNSSITDSDYSVMVHFIGHPENELIEFNYNELDSLQLAYAMTVHKSQGSEYEYVILFLNMQHNIMLHRNLLYTAVTRAKNKLFIIGDFNAITKAIYNTNVNKRLTYLKERLLKEVKCINI